MFGRLTHKYQMDSVARPPFIPFTKKKVARSLSSVKKHMEEEGESLKRILEADEHSHNSMTRKQ